MNNKLIFKKTIAEDLMKQGFVFIKTIPNYKKHGFIVYAFEETAELKNYLKVHYNID